MPSTDKVSDFLKFVHSTVSRNKKIGLGVTCLEIPQNFKSLDFSSVEEGTKDSEILWEIFQFIKADKHRVFFFLPNFYFLGSQIDGVVDQTKDLLNSISCFLDSVGIQDTSIVLRIGSAYGDRKKTMQRFCEEVSTLDDSVVSKLSVCNDEKPSLFSVTDLLGGIFYSCGLPIVFRFLPHQFNTGGLSIREAYFLAASTWKEKTVPIFMHSESSSSDENGIAVSPIPANHLKYRIPTFGLEIDVVLDTPLQEESCIKYVNNIISLKPMVINKIGKK